MSERSCKTKFLFFSLFCFLAALGPISACADQGKLDEILEGIRAYYGSLPGLTVSYQREILTRSMTLMGGEFRGDLATGLIDFKPPRSLRVEQQTPQPEEIITDGNTLWWHIPGKNQVYVYPTSKLGKELTLLSDVFQGLRDIRESFEVSLLARNSDGEDLVELKPKQAWPDVDHVVLALDRDPSRIRKIEIYNMMGGATKFTLGPLTVRERFKEGFFKFEIPEGTEVIKEAG